MASSDLEYHRRNTSIYVRKCPFPERDTGPKSCLDRPIYQTFGISTDKASECRLSLHKRSEYDIKRAVDDGSRMIVFIMRFENISLTKCYQEYKVFNYYAWTWVFKGPTGEYPLVKGPYDQDVLSAGLLKLHRGFVYVYLSIDRPNCSLILGAFRTDARISRLLHSAVMKSQLTKTIHDIRHSAYCYASFINYGYNLTAVAYYMIHMFEPFYPTNRYYTALRCCEAKYNQSPEPQAFRMECGRVQYVEVWVRLLHWVGAILCLFSPLIFGTILVGDDPTFVGKSCNSTSVSDNDGFDRIIHTDGELDQSSRWISRNPITWSNTCGSLFTCCGGSAFAVRLRRIFIFLFVLPSVVITRISLYYVFKIKHQLLFRMQFDIPLGSLAILFNFKEAAYNWKCFMGGPYIAFGCYIIVGVTLITIPRSIPLLLTHGVLKRNPHPLLIQSPLLSDLPTLSNFASLDVGSYKGSKLVYISILIRLRSLINPKFWCHCFYIWRNRYLSWMAHICWFSRCHTLNGRCCKIYVCFFPFMLVIQLILIAIEIPLLFIHNGLPLVSFICLYFTKYIQFVLWKASDDPTMSRRLCKNVLSKICVALVMAFLISCVSYVAIAFLLDSLIYLSTTINFVILGMIVNARSIVNYVLLGIIVCIYVWKSVSGINESYCELFEMVVETSTMLQYSLNKHQKHNLNQHSLLIETPNEDLGISSIRINGILFSQVSDTSYTEETQTDTSLNDSHKSQLECIRKFGSSMAIPVKVFDHVVEKHRPLRNMIMMAFIKLVITSLVSFVTINIVLTFQRSSDLDKIMQLAAVLLTGLLPLMLQVFRSPVAERRREFQFREDLQVTLIDYWRDVADNIQSRQFQN